MIITMEQAYKGKDFMLAVEQMDCEKILDFAQKNKSKKSPVSFQQLISELSDDEMCTVWEGISKEVEEKTKVLFTTPPPNKKDQQEVCHFVQAAIDLGVANFEHIHATGAPNPPHLCAMVFQLSGALRELPSSLDFLKNSIAGLCEKMLESKLETHQVRFSLITMLYILGRSLVQRAAKKEVRRVHALKSLLPHLLASKELNSLIQKAAQSTLYASMPEGQKILHIALTTDASYVPDIHKAMMQRLATCTLAQAINYGKIYYQAWSYTVKKELNELREEIEMTCIQSMMLAAIEAHQKQYVVNLRKVLAQFHSQKKELAVAKLLYDLYQPILFRHLKNPDGVIRSNAAQLFLDVFPLEDPELKAVSIDQELNEQMLLIKDLLSDGFPIVRITTIIGLCIGLSVNWELFNEDMLKTYFRIIINDLSCDSSSSEVRLAVAKGLKVILENPLTLGTMQTVLPKIAHIFHDICDTVRVAFCQLLIRVKKIAAIKYYHVVPLDDLLASLEMDPVVARPLVSLLHNSYFPPSEPPSVWLHRCVEMVKQNKMASRIFFTHISTHIGLEKTAQFMKRVVECLHFYVSSKVNSRSICILSSTPNNESAEEEEMSDKEKALGLHDPNVVSGLLDGLCILWLANITQLEKPENKPYLKMIVSKLTKCLADLTVYYKDTPVWQSVYFLSSFMPSVPSLAPLCFVRLHALSPDAPMEQSMTLLECLCAHEADSFLTLMGEWVGKGMAQVPSKEETMLVVEEEMEVEVKAPAAKKRKKSKKKMQEEEEQKKKEKLAEEESKKGQHHLAVRLLDTALGQKSCQKALLITNPEALRGMLHFMEDIKEKVELCMGQEVSKLDAEFLRGLHHILLKITAVLSLEEDNASLGVKFVEDIISWLHAKVLLSPAANSSTRKSTSLPPTPSFQGMVRGMCQDLCTTMADMTQLGIINMKSMKFLKFAMYLLQSEDGFGGGCVLYPVSRLLLRHIRYGRYARVTAKKDEECTPLRMVPDCCTKIFQHIAREQFFKTIPTGQVKNCVTLLSHSIQQLEGELLSTVTLSLIKALMNSTPTPQQESENQVWKSFEKVTVSAQGSMLLSVVCPKPKMTVPFLQLLQKNVAKTEMNPQSWLAYYAIVNTIQENKKCPKGVLRELLVVLESMEGELRGREPLKTLDPNNVPMDHTPATPTLSFEEHCLSECGQLKSRLVKKIGK